MATALPLPQPLPHLVQLVGPLLLVQVMVRVEPDWTESGPLLLFTLRSIVFTGAAAQEAVSAFQAETRPSLVTDRTLNGLLAEVKVWVILCRVFCAMYPLPGISWSGTPSLFQSTS